MGLADIETSSDGYARRFAGEVGEWMLSVQGRVVLEVLEQCLPGSRPRILDVGGGHGQLVKALSPAGFKVTVSASGSQCIGQLKDLIQAGACDFVEDDLLHSSFGDRSFDLVTCFRLLPHCPDWRRLVAELCRLADRSVLVDYPPLLSFNLFYPLLFRVKLLLEGNTRTFAVFRDVEIAKEFARHGFVLRRRRGEFFWPMVLHRVVNRRRIAQAMERAAGAVGLREAFGSPVVAFFERREAVKY